MKFEVDEDDDYLRLKRLLDPRVSYRINYLDEINRLLDRAKTYFPQLEIAAETIQPEFDEEDIWAAEAVLQSVSAAVDIDTMWINEIAEFKKAMLKV